MSRSRWIVTIAVFAASALAVVNMSCTTPLAPGDVLSKPGTTTTIILVRHAERDEGFDPPLNAEGKIRAGKLADVVAENGVTAIYASNFLRNRQTADAITAVLDVPVVLIPQARLLDTKTLANDLVAEWLDLHAGGVVMWIGNTGPKTDTQSGNLQEVYYRLGGTGRTPIRYEDFYVLVVPDEGPTHISKASYGGPSTLD